MTRERRMLTAETKKLDSHVGRAISRLEVDLADLHFKGIADHVKHLLDLLVLPMSADNQCANRISKLRGVGPRESLLFGVDGLGLCRAKQINTTTDQGERGLT